MCDLAQYDRLRPPNFASVVSAVFLLDTWNLNQEIGIGWYFFELYMQGCMHV